MAISGSGGWIPSNRVCIRDRKLIQSQITHNVYPSVVWMPEQAAARFIDCPNAFIYVPILDEGGIPYLIELLRELDLID